MTVMPAVTLADRPVSSPRCVVPFPDGSPCPAGPASALGICRGHLADAALEHARLAPALPSQASRSPASVPFRSLCPRCGRPGHAREDCDA